MKKCGKNNQKTVYNPKNNNGKAAFSTLCFCYLFLIAEIVYKVKIERQLCTWEITLLFLMFSMYGIFQKLFSKSEIPLNLKGQPLPTGNTKAEKKERNAFYRINALIYSVIFAVIMVVAFISSSYISNVSIGSELLFDTDLPNFVFGIIFALILLPIVYLISLIIEFVWYEYKISQYNLLVVIRKEREQVKTENALENEEVTEEPIKATKASLLTRVSSLFKPKAKEVKEQEAEEEAEAIK